MMSCISCPQLWNKLWIILIAQLIMSSPLGDNDASMLIENYDVFV